MTLTGSANQFERAARSRRAVLVLELYVSGTTPKSIRAIRNLKDFCDANPEIDVTVTIIDVYKNPELAKKAQVIAVPTLIRLKPKPLRRLIGDLSNKARVLKGLGLAGA